MSWPEQIHVYSIRHEGHPVISEPQEMLGSESVVGADHNEVMHRCRCPSELPVPETHMGVGIVG